MKTEYLPFKSISDDDLCATCLHCQYHPGEMSGCRQGWPGHQDPDGYVQECQDYQCYRCEACHSQGILPNLERCDACERFDSDEEALLTTCPESDWRYEVANGNTRLSYREWATNIITNNTL